MVNPIIIKFGGSLLEDKTTRTVFLGMLAREWKIQQDAKLKDKRAQIILVHGGGKDITNELEKRKIPARFEGGRRYTDESTMGVVNEVLQRINNDIVNELKLNKANAEGFNGRSPVRVRCRRLPELGFVGVPISVDEEALRQCLSRAILPVFYSVAEGSEAEALNINADDFAQELAITSHASQLIFMTDTGGIKDKSGQLIDLITSSEVERLIGNGTISGGMSVKARACVDALRRGVEKVTIAKEVDSLASVSTPRAFGTSFLNG